MLPLADLRLTLTLLGEFDFWGLAYYWLTQLREFRRRQNGSGNGEGLPSLEMPRYASVLAAADKKAHGADGKHEHAAFLVKLRAEHQTKANDDAQNFDANPGQFPSPQSSGHPPSGLVSSHSSTVPRLLSVIRLGGNCSH